MKLSFSTLGCPGWNIEKVVEKAIEYDFDGVELLVKNRRHVDVDMTLEERIYMRDLFKENRLDICCLSGYAFFGGGDHRDMEENTNLLLEYIKLAADLGAPYIRVFAGGYSDAISIDEAAANTAACLNICGWEAEKAGVVILIETHHAFRKGMYIRKILNRITNNGVAVLWDALHTFTENEAFEETYRVLSTKIKHIHIKDAILLDKQDKPCLLGMGNFPLTQLIELLKRNGYNGFLSFEWEKTWHMELEEPDIAFPGYIEHMHSILRQ